MNRLIALLIVPPFLMPVSALAHSWYAGKTIPGSTTSCCSDKDCVPLHVDKNEVLEEIVNGKEIYTFKWKGLRLSYPKADAQMSEDGGFHACVTAADGPVGRIGVSVLCFFAPVNI